MALELVCGRIHVDNDACSDLTFMALDLAWVIGVKFLFVNVGGGTKTMGCVCEFKSMVGRFLLDNGVS